MTRVLVVDDSPQITSWLSLELSAVGHKVTAAGNGQEALLAMECDAPDVMVLDVDMPLMNGFDVLRKMRARPSLQDIRVVMLTGRGREANWVQGYRLGVHDYLTKPLDIDELVQAIERVSTLTVEQLSLEREEELDLSELLLKVESAFEPAPPPPPTGTHYEHSVEDVEPDPASAEDRTEVPTVASRPAKRRGLLATLASLLRRG